LNSANADLRVKGIDQTSTMLARLAAATMVDFAIEAFDYLAYGTAAAQQAVLSYVRPTRDSNRSGCRGGLAPMVANTLMTSYRMPLGVGSCLGLISAISRA
jgi:hypothetical protein